MVMFNQLKRGIWKNISTPIVNKTYKSDATNPSDHSYSVFQSYIRISSVDSSKSYIYHRAIDDADKIAFGENGVKVRDLNLLARMPFSQPSSVTYKGRKNDWSDIKLNLFKYEDNGNRLFSGYASKYTSYNGIFYGPLRHPSAERTPISDLTWYGMSIADKDAIPTLFRANTSTYANTAGNIMTKSIEILSSSEEQELRIYNNRIRNITSSTNYYFDDDDHYAVLHYIYIISQSPGGNGGKGMYNFWAWDSGSGGGAGGYSLDLLYIPENSFVQVIIPATPQKTNENVHYSKRAPSVLIKNSSGSTLREVIGGEYGWRPDHDEIVDGGAGGYVKTPYVRYLGNRSKTIILQNIAHSKGGTGTRNTYRDDDGNINVSGTAERVSINCYDSSVHTIDTDSEILIEPIPGVKSHWDSGDTADLPGAGGSSLLGRGGDFAPLHDGYSGTGPGAGGGGGAKHIANEHLGGAGCGAAIYIGY